MGSRAAIALFAITIVACGPQPQASDDVGDDQGDDQGDDDSGDDQPPMPPDARESIAYPDAMDLPDGECSDWECQTPVDDGCNPPAAEETCNDGYDDDCDGDVDEGCHCQPGAVQSCFRGPPGRRGVGACVDGMQTCEGSGEFTEWGPCQGGLDVRPEQCDSVDNDCNGCADDHPDCCTVDLACPASMPDGEPFVPYVIDGTQFYSGTVTAWSWTVSGGPCDQLFVSQGYTPSYTLAGQTTSQLTLTPKLSGDYTITVTMTLPSGETRTCTFIVHIGGPGLRVELCWDKTGLFGADIDLHLHRPGTTTRWFELPNGNINPDDCYYYNCTQGDTTGVPNWGYANTPQADCPPGAPAAGCKNPRLDLDNIATQGKPENINVDIPTASSPFRVMVHYYGGSVTTHPIVNVYCGGHLKATYGQAPDQLAGFDHGDGQNEGQMWRVVDVLPILSGTTTTDCTLTPLHPPGMTTGYWLTEDDSSY